LNSFTRRLYLFLSACGGNWRNSIYIRCQEQADQRRGLEAAEEHCNLSATALNLKRMIRCMS